MLNQKFVDGYCAARGAAIHCLQDSFFLQGGGTWLAADRWRCWKSATRSVAINTEVATRLDVAKPTVGKWRQRFVRHRLDGLHDEPRPGAPRSITDEHVAKVVTLTLESKPKNATHWSTRSMAERAGLSQTAISRIVRAFGLQPHRETTFKISEDPQFVDKVRDVVGLYMSPPDHALVLCVDEKNQVQALDRSQPLLPLQPGSPERRTHDYYRHGTTSLFAALDVAAGAVIGKCLRQHRHQDFLTFLRHLDRTLDKQPGQKMHLVLDNYATHKTPAVRRWFQRHPDCHVQFTPTSASWLNQIERFFAEITTRRIRRSAFRSVADLEQAIRDSLDDSQQKAETVRVDRHGRYHPRACCERLQTNFRFSTLGRPG